jgi:hypothetical protein
MASSTVPRECFHAGFVNRICDADAGTNRNSTVVLDHGTERLPVADIGQPIVKTAAKVPRPRPPLFCGGEWCVRPQLRLQFLLAVREQERAAQRHDGEGSQYRGDGGHAAGALV